MAKTNWVAVIGVVAGIIILWLVIDRENMKAKIKELNDEIDANENLTEEIKRKLKELIINNKDVDSKIANELGHIAALIEIKQEAAAILKLTKIIENLLKELYKDDKELKEKVKKGIRKKPVFADYLEHAKEKKLITAEDYHLLSVMKIIRNEEAHELDVKKERSRILAAFISGIGLVLGLCQMVKGLDKHTEVEKIVN